MTAAVLLLLGVCSPAAVTEAAGRVHGVVADGSGGVLPGVTIVATAGDGRVLATAVTDGTGSYALDALPEAALTLTFELEGFSPAVVALEENRDPDAPVVQRLTLAPRSETVVVVGKVPVDSGPSQALSLPPPPPPPVLVPVPEHDRDSICGPAKPDAAAESFGTIRSLRYGARNDLYAKDDELLIDGGTLNGLEVGRNFVVRRTYRANRDHDAMTAEHTAGVLQIVAAGERASMGVVVYACDELMRGDLLAEFKPEAIRAPEPAGIPAYDEAAKILFADVGQLLGVPRRLMVIDRGSDHDLRVGQRLTLFRRKIQSPGTPSIVGDAVVVALRIDSATIRVESVSDVISFGDWAAPQRPAPTALTAANPGK
jgi:hypothetical protein